MTHSNTLRRLVLTTALTGLAAAPVAAASAESQFDAGPADETITAEGDMAVDVDARSEMDVVGASVDRTAPAQGQDDVAFQEDDAEAGLGVTAGMAADEDAQMGIGADADAIAAIDAVVDSGDAVVVTAENTVVGAIEDVETTAGGDIRYQVDLSEEFDAQRDNVTFQTAAALDADGVLKVGFSDAELTVLLDQDMRMGSN